MTDLETSLQNKSIIIYDGVCGFCNKSVQFILQNKPNSEIRFIAFQSEIAKELMAKKEIKTDMSSILLVENGKLYSKSSAVLKVLNKLNTRWKYLYYFIIIPAPIRDFCYSIIAKYRYIIMGSSDQCRLLTKEERVFFLE
ncbi:thiol-disulfide oxidoreductase DCC family protein [Aquimarina sp. 2201CG14-23]|uniref:thiol-disulfide oxidoreductase DCC family protein n=1 Tax=Aquimarina mycalae TaxID=3040073 RepID=UPI002477FDC4|nr:DCC1-like thiol-disulfide oxidoreductase family protein [Aquimarina sp. 2201CG14-23]MDH7446097.1 DCC1-like thiol-disulfide oxidoreductase family protein [Aquimarina sp. 2201CG14-23]